MTKATETLSADATEAAETMAAARLIVATVDNRETGSHAIIKAIRTAREASADGISDRALSAAIHAEAVTYRAATLGLATDAPAVLKSMTLGNVRAYVSAEALLGRVGAGVTKASCTSAYRAVVTGATKAVTDYVKALGDAWEKAPKAVRAETFPEAVTEALKAQAAAKAEAEAERIKAEAEAEAEAERARKAEAEGTPEAPEAEGPERDPEAEALSMLSEALDAINRTVHTPEVVDRVTDLLNGAWFALTGISPRAALIRLDVIEAEAEAYRADAEAYRAIKAEAEAEAEAVEGAALASV